MARTPKQEGYIDWRRSEAKEVIVEALRKGDIPLDESEMSARQVWEQYRFSPAFVGPPPVIFKQFSERLKDHRKQFKKYTARIRRTSYRQRKRCYRFVVVGSLHVLSYMIVHSLKFTQSSRVRPSCVSLMVKLILTRLHKAFERC